MLSLRESNSAQLASAWRHECCDSGSNPGSHIFLLPPSFCMGVHATVPPAWRVLFSRGWKLESLGGLHFRLARVSGCLIFLFRLRARMADGTRSFRMRRPTFELPVLHATGLFMRQLAFSLLQRHLLPCLPCLAWCYYAAMD